MKYRNTATIEQCTKESKLDGNIVRKDAPL